MMCAVVLVILSSGVASAWATDSHNVALVAIAGNTHASKIQPCSLLTTAQVTAVIGVKVKASFQPAGSDCYYTDASPPANPSAEPPDYSLSLYQDGSVAAAKKQFAHAETFLKPVTLVNGLGDASFWGAGIGSGTLWTLDGDLVLTVEGVAANGKNVSETANESVMKEALART